MRIKQARSQLKREMGYLKDIVEDIQSVNISPSLLEKPQEQMAATPQPQQSLLGPQE